MGEYYMVDEYLNNKNKRSNNFITKILLSIILCFSSLIYIKKDEMNFKKYKSYVFEKTFSFGKVNKLLNKYLDKNMLSLKQEGESALVFGEIEEMPKQIYENGVKFKYSQNNPVKTLESGIVVYIGEKENLGNTLIVQGVDGYDIWYSNIDNVSAKIYDYLEKDTLVGDTDELIITISKDGKYLDYEKYISEV